MLSPIVDLSRTCIALRITLFVFGTVKIFGQIPKVITTSDYCRHFAYIQHTVVSPAVSRCRVDTASFVAPFWLGTMFLSFAITKLTYKYFRFLSVIVIFGRKRRRSLSLGIHVCGLTGNAMSAIERHRICNYMKVICTSGF